MNITFVLKYKSSLENDEKVEGTPIWPEAPLMEMYKSM